MKLFVGVTNNNWFRFHAEREPDEVNFWRPRSQNAFRVLAPGDLFLFKLHSPLDFIAGGGVYVRHTFLPLALAWQAFGERNGMTDYRSFRQAILQHRKPDEMNSQLGCTVLVEPFFWRQNDWIPIPKDWSKNIVTGKSYDTSTEVGHRLWAQVQERLQSNTTSSELPSAQEEAARYGAPREVRPRLGQGAFRVEVTDSYHRRCAITGEKTLPALEAAHIKPFGEQGPNLVSNGLLLRSDLHHLFDQGYLTVTLDHKVEVSRRIREEFQNGRHYYALHGEKLAVLPDLQSNHPEPDFLAWHHNNCYKPN